MPGRNVEMRHRLIDTSCTNCSSSSKLRWVATLNIISLKVALPFFRDKQWTWGFFLVISSLGNFTNITLSSLYFDITKDNLYANCLSSPERRSTVTVLQHVRWKPSTPLALDNIMSQVLNTMVYIIAPVLPHLAEEIHSALLGQPNSETSHRSSVFSTPWVPLVLLPLFRWNSSLISMVSDTRLAWPNCRTRDGSVTSSAKSCVGSTGTSKGKEVRCHFVLLYPLIWR